MPANATVLAAPERNRYFYGLMMDAERFQKDQDYFNHKRALLNRFVTGTGVVCGLDLKFDKAKATLTLEPGMAIDGRGREIIVPDDTPVDITELTDARGKPAGPVPAGSIIVVSLAYRERTVDPVPVLVPDCDHPNGCAPSAIEEEFAVLVRVASGPPPGAPTCVFGTLAVPPDAKLTAAIAKRIVDDYAPPPADPSVPLGRLTLPDGPLDAAADRRVVYDNTLLYDLFVCLAERLSQPAAATLIYVSGDNQSAKAGNALAKPLVVALVDGAGNPVTGGSAPEFTAVTGGGSLGAVNATGPGQFQTTWTMGPAGPQTATAKSSQSSLTVTFSATAK